MRNFPALHPAARTVAVQAGKLTLMRIPMHITTVWKVNLAKDSKFVTEKGEKYSFKVKKNGKYTIWISDDKGNIYTKVVTVKGLKK